MADYEYGRIEVLETRLVEAGFVFGHSVTLEDDGGVLVRFAPGGLDNLRCECLSKAKEAVSIIYCCGGYAKHHLQTALGGSSPLVPANKVAGLSHCQS